MCNSFVLSDIIRTDLNIIVPYAFPPPVIILATMENMHGVGRIHTGVHPCKVMSKTL